MINLERKYRYYMKIDHDSEYRVFETRYYAQKYINEIVITDSTHDNYQYEYEIRKADNGFVIYEMRLRVL